MNPYDQAFLFCIRSLGRKAQLSSEMDQKMRRRGFSDEIREKVIQRLKELSYLNDEETGKLLVQRELKKGQSLRVASYKLMQKGLKVDEGDWEEEEREALCCYIEKKRALLATPEGKERLMRALFRKGHSMALVATLLKQESEKEFQGETEYQDDLLLE